MSWWHPCEYSTCCENYRGQCYSGGCDRNPIRRDDFLEECRRDEDAEDGGEE